MRKTVWYWDDEKNIPIPAILEKEEIEKYKKVVWERKNFWSIMAQAWLKSNKGTKCDKA